MIDVSYRYKKGVWMMDEATGEVHEVKPEPEVKSEPEPEPESPVVAAVRKKVKNAA